MLTIIDSNNIILAYLNNLVSAKVHEIINGEYTLDFVAIIDPLKTEYLYDNNNLIVYNNDYFRVVEFEELHDEHDMLTVAVTAEHISYDLINNIVSAFQETDRAAIYVMNKALTDTGFTFLGTDVTTTASIDLVEREPGELNVRNILFNIASIWQGELNYFQNSVELKQQIGINRGVDFRFGKNVKNVKRIKNFAKNTVSYNVDVVQGTEFEELGYFELGDTVRVIDDALNIDQYQRIIELEKDIITGINSTVVLGQPVLNMTNNFNDVQRSVKEVDGKISSVVDEHGKLIASKLSGTLQTSVQTVEGSKNGGLTYVDGVGIILHNQPALEESTEAMLLTANGLLISKGKNADGTWRWRTAATGASVNADAITTGTLTAINIDGVNITGSRLVSESAKARMVLDAGIFSILEKASTAQFNINYRDGLPVNVTQEELEYYNEFKATNPNKPANNTISLNSQNSHMGLEFGNGAVSLGNNWVKATMYGGTFDWAKKYPEFLDKPEYNPPPSNAQGSKLIIDMATTAWDISKQNPGAFLVYSSELDVRAGNTNLWGHLKIDGNLEAKGFRTNIPGFSFSGYNASIGGISASLPGLDTSTYSTHVSGSFSVSGQKSCVIDTEKYGELYFNAYETAETYFGDIGENEVINGECIINLDEKMIACVNTDLPYQVFLTKYGQGDIWIEQRNKTNFVVKGDNIPFGWEVKAKRKGYETVRFGN